MKYYLNNFYVIYLETNFRLYTKRAMKKAKKEKYKKHHFMKNILKI